MAWYYVDAGQRRGPILDGDFANRITQGEITSATLVWREGMTQWQPWADVQATLTGSPATPADDAAAGAVANAWAAGAAAAGTLVCSQCHRAFSSDDLINFQGNWVCAQCKPLFLQRLREGAVAGAMGTVQYAGFWIRFAAVFIDGLLMGFLNGIVTLLLSVIVGPLGGAHGYSPFGSSLGPLGIALSYLLPFIYEVYFIGKHGATVGKMACGLKVIVADGTAVGYGRSVGRYFAKILSSLTLLIGYIMAGFDDQKRALHDHICNTRVIKK